MAEIDAMAERCGYSQYLEEHLTYPPKGKLPLPGSSVEFAIGCDVWSTIFEAAMLVNPAFDPYRIFDTVRYFPLGSSIVSFVCHVLVSHLVGRVGISVSVQSMPRST